jgi:hypothetical protein
MIEREVMADMRRTCMPDEELICLLLQVYWLFTDHPNIAFA